jgi:hypothetical protein
MLHLNSILPMLQEVLNQLLQVAGAVYILEVDLPPITSKLATLMPMPLTHKINVLVSWEEKKTDCFEVSSLDRQSRPAHPE